MSNLKATKRENLTSGANNKLRAEGMIPAILYGGKDPNQNISVSKKEISNIINSDTFLSKVLELNVDGKKEKVIPRDVAFNVVSEEPIHIDFMRIVSGKKIVLEIPVKFINHPDSPGLKRGGVLNIVRRKVELRCPAENIPDEIVVDLAGTDIGTSIKISSVKLPEAVAPTITDRDFVVATVAAQPLLKNQKNLQRRQQLKGLKEKCQLRGLKLQLRTEKQLKKMIKQKKELQRKNLMKKKVLKKNLLKRNK